MSFLHCIITRFSYRFRKTDSPDQILDPKRLDHRIRLLATYCFPSIVNQKGKNFYWIIIVDPLLPQEHRDKLQKIFQGHYDSPNYNTHGPRKIILHDWDWDKNRLDCVDWFLKYFYDEKRINDDLTLGEPNEVGIIQRKIPKFLITTRLDDDDALVDNFTMLAQDPISNKNTLDKVHDFRYYSYCLGYHYYIDRQSLRITRNSMIALGLTLITNVRKWPICVYLGSHTQIPRYLRKPSLNARMDMLYKKNGEYPINVKTAYRRLKIIKVGGNPIWLRTVHGFNLQRNLPRQYQKYKDYQIEVKIKNILEQKFHIIEDPELIQLTIKKDIERRKGKNIPITPSKNSNFKKPSRSYKTVRSKPLPRSVKLQELIKRKKEQKLKRDARISEIRKKKLEKLKKIKQNKIKKQEIKIKKQEETKIKKQEETKIKKQEENT